MTPSTQPPDKRAELRGLILTALRASIRANDVEGDIQMLDSTMKLIDTFVATETQKARIKQDAHSRGDEFLWVMRKLEEYMSGSTSFKYKAFLESMLPTISKYRKHFAELQAQWKGGDDA